MAKRKCEWCGSSRHKSKACSIKHKHQALIDGVPLLKCGFDVIMEIDFAPSYFSSRYWQNHLTIGL